jgi:hypothetical protein
MGEMCGCANRAARTEIMVQVHKICRTGSRYAQVPRKEFECTSIGLHPDK